MCVTGGGTCDDGNLALQALCGAGHEHNMLQPALHLRHQLLVLFVLALVVHQSAPLPLPAQSRGLPRIRIGNAKASEHNLRSRGECLKTELAMQKQMNMSCTAAVVA